MDFRKLLAEKPFLLADGATGTLLAARGQLKGGPPEALNRENPEAVASAHRDYLLAGSVVITTNTFGANPFKLAQHDLDRQLAEINRAAVTLARGARAETGKPALIAGSMGPSGLLPPPLGPVSSPELAAGYRRQAQALEDAGVDLFLVETMSSVVETLAIVAAVREVSSRPVVVSFSFSPGRRGPRNLMGESPADATRALGDAVDCLGANCGEGPAEILEAIRLFRDSCTLPLWAKPNAGRPVLRDGVTTYPTGTTEFARFLAPLAAAGARVIGGCCGTTPSHIAALRESRPAP